jgi:methylglutaconyl-CoA hydratase
MNNAYNGEMILGLIDTFGALAADTRVRLVLIRGSGKHFQAGADLKWISEMSRLSPEANLQVSTSTTNAVLGRNQLPEPTIALVHGGCFGGGSAWSRLAMSSSPLRMRFSRLPRCAED